MATVKLSQQINPKPSLVREGGFRQSRKTDEQNTLFQLQLENDKTYISPIFLPILTNKLFYILLIHRGRELCSLRSPFPYKGRLTPSGNEANLLPYISPINQNLKQNKQKTNPSQTNEMGSFYYPIQRFLEVQEPFYQKGSCKNRFLQKQVSAKIGSSKNASY